MKILAINGSHRKGRNTAALLNVVLEETVKLGASTELIELVDCDIKFCTACNSCLRNPKCSITDDMKIIEEKLLAADGILLGSPVYWLNVTALMKNFMDRSRYLHMVKNMLAGKVGGAVTTAGLLYGGQETTLKIMESFLLGHGLRIADARNHNGGIISTGAIGSQAADFKDGKYVWRRNVADDELAVEACKQLGRNMVEMIRKK